MLGSQIVITWTSERPGW